MSSSVAELAAQVPRKRWIRIIPPAIMVYIFSYMDRAAIGFAMAGGMNRDLHITAAVAGTAAGIMFIGYLFLQVPGGHIASRGKAKLFITASIVAWGAAAALSGLITSAAQLMVLRFVLGVAEGGTFPAMLVLISNWFPVEERARANALFMWSNSLAYIVTGPVSGWIISVWGWRHVFIVEGLVTIVIAAIWYPLVTDKPEQAKWLSAAERDYLVRRAAEEQERLKNTSVVKASYKEILPRPDLWKLSVMYFCLQVGVTGYVIWLPTLVRNLTKTGMGTTGVLSGIPYIAALIGLYSFAARSDRTGNRRFYAGLPGLCFGVCFVLSTVWQHQMWLSYAFLIGCGFFQQAHNGVFWTIPPQLFPKEIAGGARGIVNGIGNLGGFVGPFLVGWFITAFHSTDLGLYSLSLFLIIAFLVSFTLPASLVRAAKAQAVQAAPAAASGR